MNNYSKSKVLEKDLKHDLKETHLDKTITDKSEKQINVDWKEFGSKSEEENQKNLIDMLKKLMASDPSGIAKMA